MNDKTKRMQWNFIEIEFNKRTKIALRIVEHTRPVYSDNRLCKDNKSFGNTRKMYLILVKRINLVCFVDRWDRWRRHKTRKHTLECRYNAAIRRKKRTDSDTFFFLSYGYSSYMFYKSKWSPEFSKWIRLIGCSDKFWPQLLTPFYLTMTMTHWRIPPQTVHCQYFTRRMRINCKTHVSIYFMFHFKWRSNEFRNMGLREEKWTKTTTMKRRTVTTANKRRKNEPHQIKCQTQSISHKVFKSVD